MVACCPLAPCSRLDVVSATPSPSSGPCPPTQRHPGALATNGGEICGLPNTAGIFGRRLYRLCGLSRRPVLEWIALAHVCRRCVVLCRHAFHVRRLTGAGGRLSRWRLPGGCIRPSTRWPIARQALRPRQILLRLTAWRTLIPTAGRKWILARFHPLLLATLRTGRRRPSGLCGLADTPASFLAPLRSGRCFRAAQARCSLMAAALEFCLALLLASLLQTLRPLLLLAMAVNLCQPGVRCQRLSRVRFGRPCPCRPHQRNGAGGNDNEATHGLSIRALLAASGIVWVGGMPFPDTLPVSCIQG